MSQPTRLPNLTTLLVAACCWLSAVAPVLGASHKARLSADLQDHINAGSQTIDVIIHGTKDEVDAVAARYNLQVRKYLSDGGAVLRVNAGQLAALRDDNDVEHLSGDIRIKSLDAVTAQAIGADQLWTGSDDLPPLTGNNI